MDLLKKFTEEKQDYLDTCERMIEILSACDRSVLNNSDKYITQLKNLQTQLADEIIRVPVVAEMSSGKSTFLNALLFGENILDASIGETTAKAFKISYGKNYRICYGNKVKDCASAEEFKESIKQINEDARNLIEKNVVILQDGAEVPVDTPEKEILLVELFLPNELLKNDLVIYDTPGFGSLNEKEMLRVLQSVLPIADGIIWLLDIAQGMKKSDIEMLAKLFASDSRPSRWFVIYTKLDTVLNVELFEEKDYQGTLAQIEETLKQHQEYQKYLNDNTKILDKHLKTKLALNTNIFTISARKALRAPNSAYSMMFKDFQARFWDYIVKEKSFILYEKLSHFTAVFNSIIASLEEQAVFAEQMGSYNEEELTTLKGQKAILDRIKTSYLPELEIHSKSMANFDGLWDDAQQNFPAILEKEFEPLGSSPKASQVQKIFESRAVELYQNIVSKIDTMRSNINKLVQNINGDLETLGVKSGLASLQKGMNYDVKTSVSVQFDTKQRTEIVKRKEMVGNSVGGAAGGAAGAYAGAAIVGSAVSSAAAVGAISILAGPVGWLLIGALALAGAGMGSSVGAEERIVEHEVVVDYQEFNPEKTAQAAAESVFENLKNQGFYAFCAEQIRQSEILVEQLQSECEHLIFITENTKTQEEFVASLKAKAQAVVLIRQQLLQLSQQSSAVKTMLEYKGDAQ